MMEHFELLGHWTGAYSQSFSCSLRQPSLIIIGQPGRRERKGGGGVGGVRGREGCISKKL